MSRGRNSDDDSKELHHSSLKANMSGTTPAPTLKELESEQKHCWIAAIADAAGAKGSKRAAPNQRL